MKKMVCPSCQQGDLHDDGTGWRCSFCHEYFTIEELIIYDQEENNKIKKRDTPAHEDD